MSRLLPPDTEDVNLADGNITADDNDDAAYSEEMSRAAVGRLFADGNDESPAASAFVTGYDRSTPPEAPERHVPRQDTRDWSKPADSGFQGRLVQGGEGGAPRPRPRREPEEPAPWADELPRGKEIPFESERPRGRRETLTSRIIQGDEDPFEAGLRDGRASMRDRERRRAGNNPDPRPAVRVNVPTEHPIQDSHKAQESRRPSREEHYEATSDEDLDGFRQRFNPGELVSSPRNPNRPVRPGQSRDVRKDRMRVESRDMETVSPLRWILAAAVIGVLVLIVFLVIRMNSFAGYRDEVESYRASAQLAQAQRDTAISNYNSLQQRYDNLRDEMDNMTANNQATDEQGGRPTDPTGETPPGQPPAVNEPFTHVVVPGEFLSTIARRFFPGVDVNDAMAHIQAVNNITNPDHIQIGQPLEITPME